MHTETSPARNIFTKSWISRSSSSVLIFGSFSRRIRSSYGSFVSSGLSHFVNARCMLSNLDKSFFPFGAVTARSKRRRDCYPGRDFEKISLLVEAYFKLQKKECGANFLNTGSISQQLFYRNFGHSGAHAFRDRKWRLFLNCENRRKLDSEYRFFCIAKLSNLILELSTLIDKGIIAEEAIFNRYRKSGPYSVTSRLFQECRNLGENGNKPTKAFLIL